MYYSIILLFPYSPSFPISLYLSGSIKPQKNLASGVLILWEVSWFTRTAPQNSS